MEEDWVGQSLKAIRAGCVRAAQSEDVLVRAFALPGADLPPFGGGADQLKRASNHARGQDELL